MTRLNAVRTRDDFVQAIERLATKSAQQTAAVAGAAAGQMHAGVEALRASLDRRQIPHMVRRPVPLGVLLTGTAVAVVIYLISRRRG